MKRRGGIEALLRWAIRDELPKVAAEAGPLAGPATPGNHFNAGVAGFALSSDGRVNCYGLLPSLAERDEPPHPDALRIGAALLALSGMEISADEVELIDRPDWEIRGFEHLRPGEREAMAAGFAAAEMRRGRDRAGRGLVDVLRKLALFGLDEGRIAAPLTIRPEPGPNGRPRWFRRETFVSPYDGIAYEREADGYDSRRKRPKDGAYQRPCCADDIAGLAERRATWQAAQAGMMAIADGLRLEMFQIDRFWPNMWPWRGVPTVGRVLYAVERKGA